MLPPVFETFSDFVLPHPPSLSLPGPPRKPSFAQRLDRSDCANPSIVPLSLLFIRQRALRRELEGQRFREPKAWSVYTPPPPLPFPGFRFPYPFPTLPHPIPPRYLRAIVCFVRFIWHFFPSIFLSSFFLLLPVLLMIGLSTSGDVMTRTGPTWRCIPFYICSIPYLQLHHWM